VKVVQRDGDASVSLASSDGQLTFLSPGHEFRFRHERNPVTYQVTVATTSKEPARYRLLVCLAMYPCEFSEEPTDVPIIPAEPLALLAVLVPMCDAPRGASPHFGCQYPVGATFSMLVDVAYVPPGGYVGLEAEVHWFAPSGETAPVVEYLPAPTLADEVLWEPCPDPSRSVEQENIAELSVTFRCQLTPPLASGSTFTGRVIELRFRCMEPGGVKFGFLGHLDLVSGEATTRFGTAVPVTCK
jgi:hypothetical protein